MKHVDSLNLCSLESFQQSFDFRWFMRNAYMLCRWCCQRAEYGTFSNRGFQVALGSGSEPIDEKGVVFSCWDKWTGRSAECATLAFLFLQLPQIILNTKNLLAGEFAALFAVPWMVRRLVYNSIVRWLIASGAYIVGYFFFFFCFFSFLDFFFCHQVA